MRTIATLISAPILATLLVPSLLRAQCTEGRVFLPTPETVAIWELNDLPVAPGEVLPSGTVIPDLSGHGLDAVVEANNDTIVASPGDPGYDVPQAGGGARPNTAAGKVNGNAAARIAVNDDGGAFEFTEADSFSLELYVRRDEPAVDPDPQWGILAGTWHSRNLLDDGGDEWNEGAWYGWGFIQRGGTPGWVWVGSPVNPDGSLLRIGVNEQRNDAPWEIPPGSHYLVASVDRAEQKVRVWLDGVQVESLDLDPNGSFITPRGYEHARFLFLTGEDDPTRNKYRSAPRGYHIDAARVERKALLEPEIEDNYLALTDGLSAPPDPPSQAVITASSTDVVVGQCVRLSAETTCAAAGEEITSWEWKIGSGPFESGEAVREASFGTPSGPDGTKVSLRVTDSAGGTSTGTLSILVRAQPVEARFAATLDGTVLTGSRVTVPVGSRIELDGSSSRSLVPSGALACPLDAAQPLAPEPVTGWSWDLDGDGSEDHSGATTTLGPLESEGKLTLSLTVRNAAGSTGTKTLTVTVVPATGNPIVFHPTAETILSLEFNGLEPGLLAAPDGGPDVGLVEDLTGNGLDLTLVDSAGGGLEAVAGATQFASNGALTARGAGTGRRGEVRDDGDAFEFDPSESFTFELYFRPSTTVTPPWGDIAGTFRARTDGADDSPRYGWGLLETNLGQPGRPGYAWTTPDQTPDERSVLFDLEAEVFHYVACVFDQEARRSAVYVDGERVAERTADQFPTGSLETPAGFPHARFYVFTREQVDGDFHDCPTDTTIDAIRLQARAAGAEEIAANQEAIAAGRGANAPEGPVATSFRRGDADDNSKLQLTDAIYVLNFLFLGGPAPTCRDAADADANGALQLTDAVYVLNFLFLGGPAPTAPYPDCGADPRGVDGALGCERYASCR